MPKPRARCATSWPIRPKPMMPSVFSCSSTPLNFARSHAPPISDACACGTLRASASSSAIVCSAAVITLDCGALATSTPRRVAASTSTLSTPTPGAGDDAQPVGLGQQVGVDLGRRTHQHAVEVGDPALELGAIPRRVPISTSKPAARSSSMPDAPMFSATRTRAVAHAAAATTQSMQAVSASTSAGSTAGNIPTRSWLRPSLRYGSTSTMPFARSVFASAAASTSSAKSMVPTTSERLAGSATNGVANVRRLGPAVQVRRGRARAARHRSRGRRRRASTRPDRRAATASPAPGCCTSGPAGSCPGRSRATATPGSTGPARRRARRCARSRPGSATPATDHRRSRTTSAARSSRRRPARRRPAGRPRPDVASISTSASPEPAGRCTGIITPVDVSLCGHVITSASGSLDGSRRIARIGGDDDRIGEERRAAW